MRTSHSVCAGTVNGLRYAVYGSGSSHSQVHNGSLSAVCGTNRLVIRDGAVFANGRHCGTVVGGAAVILDAAGRLFVNGEER